MSPYHNPQTLLQRLDELNEFERQPVSADKLQGGAYFAAVYSGEHIAATEFVIGALLVSFGARAWDVLVGLALGNLLAVLSWTPTWRCSASPATGRTASTRPLACTLGITSRGSAPG